jgi:two-component system sensor histidine kinase HydH
MTAFVEAAEMEQEQLQAGLARFVRAAEELERGYAELRERAAAIDLELQRSNRALEQALAEREAIFAALPAGVLSIGSNGEVRCGNREAERLCAAGRAVGVDLARCATGEHEVGAMRVRARRVAMPDGELVMLEDRSQVRDLEREVHRLDRLAGLSELAMGIAHEIKNPLNGVLGFAALTERAKDLPTAQRYAQRIAAGVKQVDEIVRGLLGFARGDARRRRTSTVGDLLAEAALGAGLPSHRLVVEGRRDVRVDADVLGRVLANLLRNSVEAFADVRVHARVAVVDGALELTVADDGPGIPDELRERVFDPFVSTKERGTGLGLPLAVRVLGYLGGSIELLPARARGAAFLIRVPVESRVEVRPVAEAGA